MKQVKEGKDRLSDTELEQLVDMFKNKHEGKLGILNKTKK